MSISLENVNAVNRFAATYGRGWKSRLQECWMNASYPARTPEQDRPLLQQFRNKAFGLLDGFEAREGEFRAVAHLKKDSMERFNTQRAWFVTAWRLVSATGEDLVQPWPRTKKEARETARELGYYLLED